MSPEHHLSGREGIFSNQGKVSISYGLIVTSYSNIFFVIGTDIIILLINPRNMRKKKKKKKIEEIEQQENQKGLPSRCSSI